MGKVSINQINNIEYSIPEVLDDKSNIDNFLDKNKHKKIVAVQGLGFVGAVMSLIVANAFGEEYAVIGVDIPTENSYWKICSLNEGVFPILTSDELVDQFFHNSVQKNNFFATYDPYAYSKADIIIVDINLDVNKITTKNNLINYDVDLSIFKKSIETIAIYCKEDVLILVETTVPPGTCLNIVEPIFNKTFENRNISKNYKIGHSYERVMPGPNYINSIRNFYRVYSGINETSADLVESFLKTIILTDEYPLTRLSNTTSTEMAKVLENSYRAMNIAFIDEWSKFSEVAKVDLQEVISAIKLRPTHNNIMLPGLGVGGYCLTKDSLLASWASKNFFNSNRLEISENAVRVNDEMPRHSLEIIIQNVNKLIQKKVLILGVSYLGNVGDTRYTPVEYLYNHLSKNCLNITLHDPYIKYWEECKIEINTDFEFLDNNEFDVIIFCTKHKVYKENKHFLNWLYTQKNKFLFDTNLILEKSQIDKLDMSNTLKIIGNGLK